MVPYTIMTCKCHFKYSVIKWYSCHDASPSFQVQCHPTADPITRPISSSINSDSWCIPQALRHVRMYTNNNHHLFIDSTVIPDNTKSSAVVKGNVLSCKMVDCVARASPHSVWWLHNHREFKHYTRVSYKQDRLKQENSVEIKLFCSAHTEREQYNFW